MSREKVCIITGAGGLIGSECVKYFSSHFDKVVCIDNDSRKEFFGEEASVEQTLNALSDNPKVRLIPFDISSEYHSSEAFRAISDVADIKLIIHCAAQPSHDWAASNPHRDFKVNALGTLNLLEAYREYCPDAVFIFTSTNKVYGDRPNYSGFGLLEEDTRYEKYDPEPSDGINEQMSIDQCTHSLFGVSKASADLMVQEYGRYFGLKTGVFRGGCLTGPGHKGAEQHGFLSYLVKCIKHEKEYTIYGYLGKQVRDCIHAYDVVRIFDEFYKKPKPGKVYNIGGGRHSNISIREAIELIEQKTGKKAITKYVDIPRKGDHQWYITDMSKFKNDYPEWDYTYTMDQIIDEIIEAC